MFTRNAPVAQLDRVPVSETGGHRFDSCQAHHFLFAFLLSFSTLSLADKAYWQSSDYIIDSFVDIALNNEYSTKISQIRKWNKPIFYTIKHRVADESLHQQLTEGQLAHLASITGVNISPATAESIITNPKTKRIIVVTAIILDQDIVTSLR